jgi:1-acyl-sn-glycerol-3-phosphate acyltransferase
MFIFVHAWTFLIFLLAFILLLALPVIIFAPLTVKIRLKFISEPWRIFGNVILRCGFWAKVSIVDERSEKEKTTAALYISNHQSYLDIPLILTCFRAPPIMKKEVLFIPVFGILAWLSGALAVSRGKSNSRKKVLQAAKGRLLNEKISLQYYPEGTRSKTSTPKPINEVKMALVKLAYQEKVPVIACSVHGTRSALEEKGRVSWGKKMGIIIHSPLLAENFNDEESFVKACWGKVEEGHKRLSLELKN